MHSTPMRSCRVRTVPSRTSRWVPSRSTRANSRRVQVAKSGIARNLSILRIRSWRSLMVAPPAGLVVVMDGTEAQLGGLCEGAGRLQSDANQPFARLGASSDGPGVGMLRVRVCGGVEVEAQGRVLPDVLLAGRQGRLVLAYLVCERPRAVRREELAELLWADRLPDSWPASLSAVISRLRRLFGEAGLDGTSVLLSSAGTYQLHLPQDASVDIEQLADAAAAAE